MKKSDSLPKCTKPIAKGEKFRTSRASFPIVGVGASAGGLEAVTLLLKNLSADTGMGFFLVKHLDPLHESALTALLSCATTTTVTEARDGMQVKRGQVYVIPPNKKMGINKRTLLLNGCRRAPDHGEAPLILLAMEDVPGRGEAP
jgi:two-component system CheB/CheR fusion protein